MMQGWGHTGPCQPGCTCSGKYVPNQVLSQDVHQTAGGYSPYELKDQINKMNVRLDRIETQIQMLLTLLKCE